MPEICISGIFLIIFSQKVCQFKNKFYFCTPKFKNVLLNIWPVRLGVRTPGFHPGNRGSNPLRATIQKQTRCKSSICSGFFIFATFFSDFVDY